jgi:hypothetical protein
MNRSKTKSELEDYFWSKVADGPVHKKLGSRCWEWTGHKTRKNKWGYGVFYNNYRYHLAHRYAWELRRELPKNLCVLHKCDNPKCVRFSHLFLGTQRDNVNDMVAKKRQRGVPGVLHPQHKLTDAKVQEIRRVRAVTTLTLVQIAKAFGVNYATVWRVTTDSPWKTWSHVA